MKNFVFIFVLFLAALSSVFCQKDSADNEESTEIQNSRKSSDNTKNKAESKTLGKNNEELQRPNPDFLTPDDRLIFSPKLQPVFFPNDGSNEGDAIPHLGFSNSRDQRPSFLLSDNTGRYVVQLQNFRQPKPSHFSTAVGAISAHLLNQGTNQEYIPYPPNGDPYNYPAYRGYPHATEPPVVKAYEMATHSNYGVQPSANYDHYSSRRIFPNNGYHQGFANQFDNFGLGFYNNPYDFNQGLFYSGLRRSDEPVYQESFPENQRDYVRRPIKRYL